MKLELTCDRVRRQVIQQLVDNYEDGSLKSATLQKRQEYAASLAYEILEDIHFDEIAEKIAESIPRYDINTLRKELKTNDQT